MPSEKSKLILNKGIFMFIISLTYRSTLEEIDKHLEAHSRYLKTQYENGSFIMSGRKVPRTGGIILSNLKTRMEVEETIEKDPFKIAGLSEYDIIEFTPTMFAEGFDKLIL